MELKAPILSILNKQFQPDTLVETTFKRYDLSFKTDETGRPVLLFLGQKNKDGKIRGERYARRIQLDKDGKVIKDDWDHKGKATP